MLFLLDIHQNNGIYAYAVFKCNADYNKDATIILKSNRISIEFTKNSSPYRFNVIMPEDFVCISTVGLCHSNAIGCITICEEDVTKLNLNVISPDADLDDNDDDDDDEGEEEEGPIPLEFIFRFYIQSYDVMEKCMVRRFDSPPFFRDVMYEKYKEIDTCKVICTNCGTVLTEKILKFESVKQYYNCKAELDEASFCHKHDEDQESPEVNANSLFIDDMYFYFHHSIIPYFNLLEENKTYKCSNCSSTLSFQKKMDNLQYFGFFGDKIMLTKSPDEENYEKHKINACLLSFYSIIQETFKTQISPKFYLQSKVGEATDVLLLWIDEEIVLHYALEKSDESKTQEDVELKLMEAYTAVFYSTTPESDISRDWKHDFGVEFFQVSDNMMDVVKGLIEEREDYFSDWIDHYQGFSYGYIPVEVPVT